MPAVFPCSVSWLLCPVKNATHTFDFILGGKEDLLLKVLLLSSCCELQGLRLASPGTSTAERLLAPEMKREGLAWFGVGRDWEGGRRRKAWHGKRCVEGDGQVCKTVFLAQSTAYSDCRKEHLGWALKGLDSSEWRQRSLLPFFTLQ